MIKHTSIPSQLKVCKYWVQAFTLLPRKYKFRHGNIELRYGMKYWIWSRYSRCFYEREIKPENDTRKLIEAISKSIVYLDPTEEEKETIQAEMEYAKLDYYPLQRLRLIEYELDKHIRLGERSYGYMQRKHKLETMLNQIK